MSEQESDQSILVRDGRTAHMAKGLTGQQRDQSTHAREKNVPTQSVSSSLIALRAKASLESGHRFGGLYTMIDGALLRESFQLLRRDAASGVDGQSVADYESDLEANLVSLLDRLKGKSYRAKLVRRKYISKGGGKFRPLGIPAVEDKIVQMAARRILEAIYEADFLETSRGYRSGKDKARETKLGGQSNFSCFIAFFYV